MIFINYYGIIQTRGENNDSKTINRKLQEYPKNTVVQVGASYAWEYCQGNITDVLPDKPRTEYRKSDIGKTCVLLLADNEKDMG